MKLSEQLKQAITASGKSRYKIAKEAGIDYYALARFLDEDRDIRLSTVQKLADLFGMRLTKPKRV